MEIVLITLENAGSCAGAIAGKPRTVYPGFVCLRMFTSTRNDELHSHFFRISDETVCVATNITKPTFHIRDLL